MALGARALDLQSFAPELVAALFEAVLADDEIDDELYLPDHVEVDFTEAELIASFRLSRQLWREGFDRGALKRFAEQMAAQGRLGETDRRQLKHIRAKFKQFRYAFALLDASHRYPPLLNAVTVIMGQAQDALRHGQAGPVRTRGALLRLLLTQGVAGRLLREGDRLAPVSPAGFRALLAQDLLATERLLARPAVTGHEFHAARKIFGRQVSFWCTLQVLAPSPERHRVTRWLSAINGAMGSLHDELVERRVADGASYRRPFALPAGIGERIAVLNERTRASLAVSPG